jgi:hypothetical protein
MSGSNVADICKVSTPTALAMIPKVSDSTLDIIKRAKREENQTETAISRHGKEHPTHHTRVL